MLNKKFRLCFSIIAVMALILVNVSAAQAGEAFGSYTRRAVYMYTYYDRAAVNTESPAGWAYTDIYTSGYVNVPTAYMGAGAQLFSADGALCKSGGVVYNTSPTSVLSVGTGRYTGPSGFFSMGLATYYNGSGYNNFWTTSTPTLYINAGRAAALMAPAPLLPENENDQTLGNAYVAQITGELPDLVSAVTTDGVKGYVYSQDIQPKTPSDPQEALAMNAEIFSNPSIPVYAEDGTTIIGTFQFTPQIISEDTAAERNEAPSVDK
ncbi:hypothetical protein [Anaerocolumna xylanovorans]|uniref:Uncharacterized protein n=1 Tax=Anaerocolumna xylanovorans DSM 12503 TaxID=1121345 RepID=A0A1M7YGH7_9FIRM|nr:hypothetical protein [Anaerocolumna xylanovorans]SHO51747.1 hypothetical protein SAMN02745217_03309 [Anaerocolumna xylanovorans DSM 12503]